MNDVENFQQHYHPHPIEDHTPKEHGNDFSLEAAMGQVPIVQARNLHPLLQQNALYFKLEGSNPAGSVKDKNAAYLIEKAIQSGELKPGGTIIESSSGNLGIALAMIGAARGFAVKIVIDAKTSKTMRNLLRAYGAELIEVDKSACDEKGSMQMARMKKALELSEQIPNAYYVCQHLNPLTPYAHYYTTGPEIARAFPQGVDYVVVGVSTAGQVAGISKFMGEHFPQTKVIGVDVKGSAVFNTPRAPYKMTGLGLSFVPPAFHQNLVDEAYVVDDQLSFSLCHLLAKKDGLLLGASTGALTAVALHLLQRETPNTRVLVISADYGTRYMDTVYSPEWLANEGLTLLDMENCMSKISELTTLYQ